jgi:hypothetical protein
VPPARVDEQVDKDCGRSRYKIAGILRERQNAYLHLPGGQHTAEATVTCDGPGDRPLSLTSCDAPRSLAGHGRALSHWHVTAMITSLLDQPGLQGQPGQVGTAPATGLVPDPVQVRADGAHGNVELTGDLGVGLALGNQADQFLFPVAEL